MSNEYTAEQYEAMAKHLRDSTPNWRRESFGDWKDCVSTIDRAPKDAADMLRQAAQMLRARDMREPVTDEEVETSWMTFFNAQQHGEYVRVSMRAALESFQAGRVPAKGARPRPGEEPSAWLALQSLECPHKDESAAHIWQDAILTAMRLILDHAEQAKGAQGEAVAELDYTRNPPHLVWFKPMKAGRYQLYTAPRAAVPDGAARIATERKRQTSVEGWTPEHDASHGNATLTKAAFCYAIFAASAPSVRDEVRQVAPKDWPWEAARWKPGADNSGASRIRELEKAGALIAAEIDRLLSAAPSADAKEFG